MIRAALLEWFDSQKRDLPWRRTKDPYAIWISEVMLQQTQVQTVIPYYQRFLARFPTPRALAESPLDEVLAHWRGLGYYARARNLHRAAQAICERHGGALPDDLEALRALPGFGRYTAGAVASIAFGLPAPLVDGNVARVLSRLFSIEGAPGDRVREAALWAKAETLVEGPRPGDFNQALMELGATVCRKESPLCLLCPVRGDCQAHREGRIAELPPARVRAPRKTLLLAAGVLEKNGALLLGKREGRGLFGGLWELPSVELEPEGLAARFAEAIGGKVEVREGLGEVKRTLTHRDLTLRLFRLKGRVHPKPGRYAELRFVAPEAIAGLGVSTAMQQAIALALEGKNASAPARLRTAARVTGGATGAGKSRGSSRIRRGSARAER